MFFLYVMEGRRLASWASFFLCSVFVRHDSGGCCRGKFGVFLVNDVFFCEFSRNRAAASAYCLRKIFPEMGGKAHGGAIGAHVDVFSFFLYL